MQASDTDANRLLEAVLQQPKVKVTNGWNIASICALLDQSKVLKELDVSSKCGTNY